MLRTMINHQRSKRTLVGVLLLAALILAVVGSVAAHDQGDDHPHHFLGDGVADTPLEMDELHEEQHGPPSGHLPGSSLNVELVGQVTVSGATGVDKPSHIADVAVMGNYAYLAARRLNTSPCGQGGVYVVDISDPTNPTEVGFIAFPPQSYPGEGMQVISLNTPKFKGDVLVTNNENCTNTNPNRVGGMSIYDVTNPLNVQPLAIGKGDTNAGTLVRARQIHSVFAWQAGKRAFAIIVDNEEVTDVDIMEITDPRNPQHIAEVSILNWPDAQSPLANGDSIFLHDMVVKKVKGDYLALLSYWDTGWIVLNVNNPANPVFVVDSDHPNPEPLLGFSPPEGNAHQAEWSHNNKFIIGTDEDFGPARLQFQITTPPNAGFFGGGQFSWTVPIATKFAANGGVLQGPTIWGGSGCVEDTNGNGISDRNEVPPASSLPANPGEAKVVVFSRGVCFFSIKVESGELAGYDAVIIGQSHAGSRDGLTPDGFICGGQGSPVLGIASGVCIGHRAMHLLFNDTPEYTPVEVFPGGFPPGGDLPAIGALGGRISAQTTFDGWGTIHLLDGTTLQEIDNHSISQAIDPAFATGFGTMSVHEVAMDKEVNLGYLSWYDAGIRVVSFGPSGIQEVGHYVDSDIDGDGPDVSGNDFWGVEAHRLPADPTETTYILGSDRDSGLWIFKYTGPVPPDSD